MPRRLDILDFDVECLPGHWIGGDFVSKIITAAAWAWIGDSGAVRGKVHVRTHYETEAEAIAEELAVVLREADIVTGHYIRGFDLPLVNGNLFRGGLPPLGTVLAHDTKQDLPKMGGRSKSQKNIAAQLGIPAPKVDVSLFEWEGFNTRRPGFMAKGIERVRGDVIQNIQMREALIARGWLGPPRPWEDSHGPGGEPYHA